MDILAEHAARKTAKLELQSSFKSSPVARDVKKRVMRKRMKKRLRRRRMKKKVMKKKVMKKMVMRSRMKKMVISKMMKKSATRRRMMKRRMKKRVMRRMMKKRDSEPSSSEDEKPLKKKTTGKGKGPRYWVFCVAFGQHRYFTKSFSKFAPKKKKRIFATDIAEKLVRSTRVDFMFKVNFLMLFTNVMGKADTMRAFVNLSVVRRIREDTNIAGLDWCDFIHRCLATSHEPNIVSGFYNGPLCFLILLYLDSTKFDRFLIIRSRPAIKNWTTKNMSTRQYLEIEDEAFGKLEIYGDWSENETVEAEGFCGKSLVLPHTDKKIICEMVEEKLSRISKEKAEVETLLRDAKKEFPNDDNVKKLFEKYKGFFKENVLLKETKAHEASVKAKPAVVKEKEAAEKPKPVENVKELAEKPKEPAEKAQEAPQNVKPKPASVKTKEVAEKPKSAENVKEVAEKPKEPAEKAYEAPQYVKPKPTAVKTNEAAEKPMPAENWIKGNIDWVGEVIDSISAAYLDDELHDWPWVVEPINMVQPSTPKRVFSSPSKGYVKPVKTVNTPYMCRRIDVTSRCKRIEFVLVEAEGFCENSSVLPHTDKKIICEMNEEKLSRISKEKAEVKTLLRDANKEFLNDDNVKKLFEQYKGFFKETVLLEETKAQEASVKTNPADVKAKEAAEKPKPVENVKELVEKPKEPAEKAQEAPQNVKPKPAAVKTKEAAEKPKPAENVKEVAEKPKDLAEKAHEAPQYVKPKPAAVKTKEAAEKPIPAKNVKELAEKPKEPAGDDYQVVPAATVMKAKDREEFKLKLSPSG
nr:ELM2 domain-containing protein [Tanacetum cinerariifolium]